MWFGSRSVSASAAAGLSWYGVWTHLRPRLRGTAYDSVWHAYRREDPEPFKIHIMNKHPRHNIYTCMGHSVRSSAGGRVARIPTTPSTHPLRRTDDRERASHDVTADALPYVRTSDRPETDERQTPKRERVSHAHAARGHRDEVSRPDGTASRFERRFEWPSSSPSSRVVHTIAAERRVQSTRGKRLWGLRTSPPPSGAVRRRR